LERATLPGTEAFSLQFLTNIVFDLNAAARMIVGRMAVETSRAAFAFDGMRRREPPEDHGLTIQRRVLLLQLVAAAGVAILGFIAYYTLVNADFHIKRVDHAHAQLEALIEVAEAANRYSENVAEVLLTQDPSQVSDLAEAKGQVEASLSKLERMIQNEARFLADSGQPLDPAAEYFTPQGGGEVSGVDPADAADETVRIRKFRQLYRSIDMAAAAVFALDKAGKRPEALARFKAEIEDRHDVELDRLIKAAIEEEADEHVQVSRMVAAQVNATVWAAGVASFLTVLLSLVMGHWLVRSLRRPVAKLMAGTAAFARGDLAHRIDYAGADELGQLAQHFNAMAASLQENQKALADERANLEKQVAQRTAELHDMNRSLTELGDQRTQFLADISHELRTPLTALRGEAEVTLRHGGKPEAVYRDALHRIVAHSADMGRLIEDLLLLARAETEEARFSPKRVALAPILLDAARDAVVLGTEKRIKVEPDIATEPVLADVDPQRLKQALMILLDNAIKFSAPGQTVGLRLAPADGHAVIAVSDHGAGFSEKDLPHVFKRFYRGRGAARSNGSGLGLSIAKWIVEKHGGYIGIESTPTSRTEVSIRIPIHG
jgi:signal transduction histidine kinase